MPEGDITSARDPRWGFAGHNSTLKTLCVDDSSNNASVREHHAVCGLTACCIHSVVGDTASCRRCHWACSTFHGGHTDADHGLPLMREPSQKRRVSRLVVWCTGAAAKTLCRHAASSRVLLLADGGLKHRLRVYCRNRNSPLSPMHFHQWWRRSTTVGPACRRPSDRSALLHASVSLSDAASSRRKTQAARST